MDSNLNIKLSSEESKYQKELLHFKNDLLKNFKQIESKWKIFWFNKWFKIKIKRLWK